MKSLEAQVRAVLIEQKTDELIRFTSEYPQYKSIVTKFAGSIMDSIVDSATSFLGDANKEEIEEIRQESRKEFLSQVQAKFDNPEQLRQMMYEQARNQYMSTEQVKSRLSYYLTNMKQTEKLSKVINNLEKTCEGLFEFIKTNDSIVEKLVRIAEREGVDKATQKETRYAVVKKMFPTSKEYRAFLKKGEEIAMDLIQQSQNALMADAKAGQHLSGVVGTIGKEVRKLRESFHKVYGTYLDKTVQDIYR